MLGIVGFVLSFFAIVNVAGLIISVIALVRSHRAGFRNGFALAGTVISSIGVIITVVVATFAAMMLVGAAQTSSADDERWSTANKLYAQAVCPTNAAREALYAALGTNDLAQIIPVAASASEAFDDAADVFLDHSWPDEVDGDIQFLADTSVQLAQSWGEVAASENIDEANSVAFPDAQRPFEAAQRIRAALSEHGQESLSC